MDVRVARTRDSIINAFLELRAKKPIEKITVKELCEKAGINKSTFYSHFQDIYALSEYLEEKVAGEVLSQVEHPETLLTEPDVFVREVFYAYMAQGSLIRILFSGRRYNQLLVRIDQSIKELLFELRPEYRDNVKVNILCTMTICGNFYTFEKCRHFGEEKVIEIVIAMSRKWIELLPEMEEETSAGNSENSDI